MTPEELQAKFAGEFPGADRVNPGAPGILTMKIPSPADIVPVAVWLKEKMGFGYLDMVTAVDCQGPVDARGYVTQPNPNVFAGEGKGSRVEVPSKSASFNYREAMEIVYLFSNFRERLKVFVKLEVPRQEAAVPSLCSVYKAADWQEREVFDLFGVTFSGHPNLTKILTPDFIQGHPLRKDYVHVQDKFD